MALDTLTLDQLRTLDAVAREGSFAAAARSLHRVPSAISYTIRQMEEALGVEVFDRSGHRVELSPAGIRLLEQVRRVLEDTVQLGALAHELASGWEPELRLVIDAALPRDAIVAGLVALDAASAPTRVRLYEETQEGVIDRFLQDDGDLMWVLGEDEHVEHLPWGALPDLEMVLVAAPSHPLHLHAEISRSDLDAYVSIVVLDSARHYARTPRESYLDTAKLLYVGTFAAKRTLLLAGLGFGWMPLHQVRDDLDSGALRQLTAVDPHRWTYHPRVVWRGDRSPGPAARTLLEAWNVTLKARPAT